LVFVLSPKSIDSWNQLQQKFHDHFFSGDYQLKLTDLTSIKQGRDETISNYLKRFKKVKNCCFNLSHSDSNLANLATKDLKSSLREILEGVEFYLLNSESC
jgi:predicted PolB exonuclease-like 3'-5' exonuclease